jgi:hypothetical protein
LINSYKEVAGLLVVTATTANNKENEVFIVPTFNTLLPPFSLFRVLNLYLLISENLLHKSI